MTACLIGGSTIDMVLRDRPGPVRLALDAHARPPHRLEPPHMGFGKRLRSRGIVPPVKIDRILPAVRCRSLGDNALCNPDLTTTRRQPDDRALRVRWDGVSAPELDLRVTSI